MNDKNYTEEDSREVRKIYYEAVRKQKLAGIKDERKFIITQEEWDKFKKQGRDMSQYEEFKSFQKRMRMLAAAERKKEFEARQLASEKKLSK